MAVLFSYESIEVFYHRLLQEAFFIPKSGLYSRDVLVFSHLSFN